MTHRYIPFLTLLFLLTTPFSLSAKTAEEILNSGGTAEEIGWAIAKESDDRDIGFHDQLSRMKMILKNAQGQENTRQMRLKILENPDLNTGDKSIIVFDEPRDIAGTALLSHAKILEPDDQWLYLPALKRTKRISSNNKSGPFMGSEFAYEDITANEINKYNWKYLDSEPCGSLTCFKLETTPKYEHSGYTKRIVWIDQTEFRAQQIDYYDRKDSHIKTQTYADYKKYLNDRYWRAGVWKVINLQNGKSTELHFDSFEFETGLDDNDFSQSALQRVR